MNALQGPGGEFQENENGISSEIKAEDWREKTILAGSGLTRMVLT
jgi:hypothetical protein